MKHSYSNDDTCLSIDVIDEILEEDFDALLDEGSKILHSIEGTLLEEEIFVEFDKFMAMTADENSDSESDTKDPSFEKITINTDYKIKTSIKEPPTDLKLKPLPDNLEYVFLEEPSFLHQAFAWKTTDIPGNCPSFWKHKIQLLDDKKPVVQKQRRLNPNMQEVVKKEIMKLLDTDIIYPIADSPWVSPIHCVPKKCGITVVTNENDELVPTRTITGWRIESSLVRQVPQLSEIMFYGLKYKPMGLTARGRNSKSPFLVMCGKIAGNGSNYGVINLSYVVIIEVAVFRLLVLDFLAVIQGMHMTRWWDTNQDARKHPEPSWLNDILDDEVSCDGGCCSKKKTWSIA
ncbi:hypothetical protein Tco_0079901 [Tanacetum coccineum]